MTFRFEDLVTVAGATAAAALVSALIQIGKVVIPQLFERLTGASWSFIGLTIVYLIGGVVLAPTLTDANLWLAYFISWVGALMIALGLHTLARDPMGSLVKPAGDVSKVTVTSPAPQQVTEIPPGG